MASTLLIVLLVVFFCSAFASVISFLPYFCGIIYGFFLFLLDLVSSFLYPVGTIPKVVVGGSLIFLIIMFIIKLITKNH